MKPKGKQAMQVVVKKGAILAAFAAVCAVLPSAQGGESSGGVERYRR
jgi:hypothetical protein